jgi:hypothetical protein
MDAYIVYTQKKRERERNTSTRQRGCEVKVRRVARSFKIRSGQHSNVTPGKVMESS